VPAHDDDVLIRRIRALDLAHGAGSTNHIQGGNTEQTLGVIDTGLLEDLADNWDSRVHGVGYNEDVGVGGGLSNGFGKVTDDRGVGVEEIVAGHAGLAGNTGRDQDDLSAFESGCKSTRCRIIAGDFALGVDVAHIGSDAYRTRSVMLLMVRNSFTNLVPFGYHRGQGQL
jgi:hypothetical protein